jgi:hypothetical protein
VGTTKPEKGVEISLTPLTENGMKPQLGIEGAAATDSIRPESPDILYIQHLNSSSKNEGRFLFLLLITSQPTFFATLNASLSTQFFCN